MKIIPFDSFNIDTRIEIDFASQRLNQTIKPKRIWNERTAENDMDYEGWVEFDKFLISRIPRHSSNLSFPVVHGTLHSTDEGTKVSVKVTLSPSILLFGALMYGGIGILELSNIKGRLTNFDSGRFLGFFVYIAIIFISYAVTMSWFNREVETSRCFLQSLLNKQ